MRTLKQQIEANRRASVVLGFLLILLLAALGAAITGAYAPEYWIWGGVGSAVLGLIMALVARYDGANIVLALSGAREANAIEDQVLRNVTEEMAIAAGIPMPKLYVIEDSALNAFATGKDPKNGIVVVTTGLIGKLDRDELQGVVAHEMAHIRNFDIQFMTTIALIAGLIPLLADGFRRSLWHTGGSRSRRDNDNGAAIFMIVALILSILAPIFAVLLQLAVSRKREYLADATAAELTRFPEGLANALLKLSSDHEPLEAANRATQHMYIVNPFKAFHEGANTLFSTHPPIEDRVKALRGLMGQYRRPVEQGATSQASELYDQDPLRDWS